MKLQRAYPVRGVKRENNLLKRVEKSRTSFFAMVLAYKFLQCNFITKQLPVYFHSFSSGIAENMDRAGCGKIQQSVCIPVTQGFVCFLPE